MKFNELKKIVDEKGLPGKDSQKYVKNLNIILDVVKSINRSLILEDVLELVLKYAIELTETERGFVVLINDKRDLEFKLGLDATNNKLPENAFNLSSTVIKDVFESGEAKFIESAQTDTKYDSSKSIINLDLQTIYCSPLIVGSQKIGVLYVDSKQLTSTVGGEITNTFEILSGQASIAIHNAKLYNEQINAYKSLQKAIDELIVAKERIEQIDKLKTNLLANLSHEFRTPLHGIMGYIQLIGDEDDRLSAESMLNGINELSKRLLITLDEILQYSEIESNTITPNWKNLDISELLLPLINQFTELARIKGLDLRLVNLKDEPILISTDHYILSKAVEYLIDNAVKFTKNGFIEIQVDKFEKNKEVFCKINIIDTGIGIDKKDHQLIFLPFRQASEGMSRGFEGSGLGLTISKRLIELVNGNIEIKSIVGQGTTFSIAVPLAQETVLSIPKKPNAKTIKNRIPRILLVEDNHANVSVIEKFLVDKFEVDSVYNGLDAIKLAQQDKYDLILMDINLGDGIDGIETTKHFKKNKKYKDIPIIAITGYALAGDQEKILDAGCDGYLPKPFTREKLITYINSFLIVV